MTSEHIFYPGEHALIRHGVPNPGYTLHADAVYERKRVCAAPWRLKEWDFIRLRTLDSASSS